MRSLCHKRGHTSAYPVLALSKNRLIYWSAKGRNRRSRQSTKMLKMDNDLLTSDRLGQSSA